MRNDKRLVVYGEGIECPKMPPTHREMCRKQYGGKNNVIFREGGSEEKEGRKSS